MNPSLIKRKLPASEGIPGVYVSLGELIRLQHQARGFDFLPKQPTQSLLAGRRASRVRGRGFDFEEIRRYLPGDDIRSIDWKVTARTRKTHTRVFTEERDRPTLLVVDQRIAMFFGTRHAMKSVTAAQLAALAAWTSSRQGDRTGALVFDDRDVDEIRPHRSRASTLRILEAIANKNRALEVGPGIQSRPAMLNEVLAQADRVATHDHLVIIVSDFDGVDEGTRKLVLGLKRRGDVVCFLVHDPSATEGIATERLVVSDGQLQLELDLGDGRTRRRLLAYSSGRLDEVISWQRDVGIPVVPITTAEDPVAQVRQLFGARRLPGKA